MIVGIVDALTPEPPGLTITELMFDRATVIASIEAGGCACPGCPGELTDANLSARGWQHCKVCRCAWKVEAINGTNYASSIKGKIHASAPVGPPRPLTDADYDGHEDLR